MKIFFDRPPSTSTEGDIALSGAASDLKLFRYQKAADIKAITTAAPMTPPAIAPTDAELCELLGVVEFPELTGVDRLDVDKLDADKLGVVEDVVDVSFVGSTELEGSTAPVVAAEETPTEDSLSDADVTIAAVSAAAAVVETAAEVVLVVDGIIAAGPGLASVDGYPVPQTTLPQAEEVHEILQIGLVREEGPALNKASPPSTTLAQKRPSEPKVPREKAYAPDVVRSPSVLYVKVVLTAE
ncbi:hypothetical protein HDU83_009868 [Entophlyctis luteolus]|nr:hypothetical protein HDU83_009868 [Entophlyctis luteolus]